MSHVSPYLKYHNNFSNCKHTLVGWIACDPLRAGWDGWEAIGGWLD